MPPPPNPLWSKVYRCLSRSRAILLEPYRQSVITGGDLLRHITAINIKLLVRYYTIYACGIMNPAIMLLNNLNNNNNCRLTSPDPHSLRRIRLNVIVSNRMVVNCFWHMLSDILDSVGPLAAVIVIISIECYHMLTILLSTPVYDIIKVGLGRILLNNFYCY